VSTTFAQVEETRTPARFFSIAEPINSSHIGQLRSSALPYLDRAAENKQKPVLVFEFRAVEPGNAGSELWPSAQLAEFLSSEVSGAKLTIAYVPHSLSGYALLPVLACDEIVLGPDATLGPITTDGQPVNPIARTTLETLAKRKGRDVALLSGMLDTSADLREVQTENQGTRFVAAGELEAFRRENQVLAERPAWEGGQRGVLSTSRARDLQIASHLAANRTKLVAEYQLDARGGGTVVEGPLRPKLIRIDGPIDSVKQQYVERQISQAVLDKVNFIILRINSEGGLIEPARAISERVSKLSSQGVQTVAFIDDRAMGMASLVALACDEIVVRSGAGQRLGDITKIVPARGAVEPVRPTYLKPLAEQAEMLAREKFHPEAVARAMVDVGIEVLEARDNQSGAVVYVVSSDLEDQPEKYTVLKTVKAAGDVLEIDARAALALGLARHEAASLDEWLAAQGLQGIRVDQPSWVDNLVITLNSPWMSGLLLFIGLFMLILELKLPGVGLPAIVSALAFLLFFWSHYLGGTADSLEILLFLAGLIAMALELFVFPGFGIFGVTGILLVLGSVIMASHTFIWPTQDYEFRQLGGTMAQLTAAIVGVVAAVVVLGRYFPSMPLFKRMILVPQDPDQYPDKSLMPFDSTESLAFLLGERGRTTSICRPIGKARFGEVLVDVIADGFYLEADLPVEVIEVRGTQVLVKKL
jgi:membrane-bound serine protease (ClpP class)